MESKAFKKWSARIENGPLTWTEHEIIYLRKAIGYCGLKSNDERQILRYKFQVYCEKNCVVITKVHDRKGQNYMLSKSLKQNGQLRKNNKLSGKQIEIMKALDFHRIIGLYNTAGNNILPVYRAVSKVGSFDYTGATYEIITIFN